MPEHDTFDLDAAFRALEQDIAGISSPHGAGAAIATARRRRRTTIGAAAAVALVVVGGIGGAGLRHHDRGVQPLHGLPAPAPLNGPHLSAATDGWTPAWTAGTEQARNLLAQTFGGACFGTVPGGATGMVSLANSHDDLAAAVMSDYGTHAAAEEIAWQKVVNDTSHCRGATEISSFSDDSGAEGHTFRIPAASSGSAPQYLWIVSTGHGIGMLKVLGQSDPLPTATDRPVAEALLAAVQVPSSYVSTGLDQSDDVPFVVEPHFARALRDWHSGWVPSGEHGPSTREIPCYDRRWLRTAWASSILGLGGNGRQDLALFHTAADARSAAISLVRALRTCSSARYTVARPLDTPRSLLATASGPTVVWVAQHDDAVGVVCVPSTGTDPPRQVSVDVGGLMFTALDSLAATSNGS